MHGLPASAGYPVRLSTSRLRRSCRHRRRGRGWRPDVSSLNSLSPERSFPRGPRAGSKRQNVNNFYSYPRDRRANLRLVSSRLILQPRFGSLLSRAFFSPRFVCVRPAAWARTPRAAAPSSNNSQSWRTTRRGAISWRSPRRSELSNAKATLQRQRRLETTSNEEPDVRLRASSRFRDTWWGRQLAEWLEETRLLSRWSDLILTSATCWIKGAYYFSLIMQV